jgi:DNA-binding NarL/FixJ family response regulator
MPFKKTQVVLVDLGLPKMSGVECVRELKTLQPSLFVLILTIHEDVEKIFKSLAAGAHGYLLKTTEPAEIISAMKEVCNGGAPMTPSIARKVIQHFHRLPKDGTDLTQLTEREQEIMEEVATGRVFKEVADRLGISYETVKVHVRNVYHKLHVTSRTAAVLKFLGRQVER